MELAGDGFPVTSETARDMVWFVSDFESANLDYFPVASTSSVLGWQGARGADGFL